MNLGISAKTLKTQESLKCSKVDDIIYHDFFRNNKSWLATPTAPYTTSFSERLIVAEMIRMDFYDCKQVGESIFECNFVGNAETEE